MIQSLLISMFDLVIVLIKVGLVILFTPCSLIKWICLKIIYNKLDDVPRIEHAFLGNELWCMINQPIGFTQYESDLSMYLEDRYNYNTPKTLITKNSPKWGDFFLA